MAEMKDKLLAGTLIIMALLCTAMCNIIITMKTEIAELQKRPVQASPSFGGGERDGGERKRGNIMPNPGFEVADFLSLKSPPNLPSERVEDAALVKTRHFYGGKGDKAHLGGFTANDTHGQSPMLWTWMAQELVVQSVVDVGCGRGISTSWFKKHKMDVLCVEGSHDAVEQSLLDPEDIVEHDFQRGPYWPAKTYDVAWSVEFLEHVGRQYRQNYLPIFRRAALIFVTHSFWGGWHHVEVHNPWWWKVRFELDGFVYSKELTDLARYMAGTHLPGSPQREAQHLTSSLLVFINPAVATLPKHQHLLGGDGCFGQGPCGDRKSCPCSGADEMPPRFSPVPPGAHDKALHEELQKHIDIYEKPYTSTFNT